MDRGRAPISPSEQELNNPSNGRKPNNFEIQIEINEKSRGAESIYTNDTNKECVDVVLDNNLLSSKYDSNIDSLADGADSLAADEGHQVPRNSSKSRMPQLSRHATFTSEEQDPTEMYMNMFNEKKKVYFEKHNLSNEYEKLTNNPDLVDNSLFETKTKQNLIKTFKFNANSRFHIKNMKFNVADYACENTHQQHAKMAFYDTLLNKGGSNLNSKYLKALNSANNRYTSKSFNKFTNDSFCSTNDLNNQFTNTTDTLATGLESARTYNSKLPGLKRRISGNTNQTVLMERINKTARPQQNYSSPTRDPPERRPDILNDPQLSQRCEASEYYNNKIRLIAKLIEKHNAKKDEEKFLQSQKKTQKKSNNRMSATSKKSNKNKKNNLQEDSIDSHFTASFPIVPFSTKPPLKNALTPFKTTKLDRQFKRVIHIDHNSKFKSKSNSTMGENNSQFYGEKPTASRNPFNAKSNIKLYSLIANENDRRDELTKSDKTKNSANLVKIKFPTISSANKTDFDNASPGNLFASSSFVKSENTYKDTIKS